MRTGLRTILVLISVGWCGLAGAGPVRTPEPGARAIEAPAETERFAFAVFGDQAPGGGAGRLVLERAVETANDLGVRFVMTTGNMIQGDRGEATWAERAGLYRTIMGGLNAPWYPVPGSLDTAARTGSRESALGLYRERFGPMVYSFDSGWIHVVVLPSELLLEGGPAREGIIAWLRDDLRTTRAEQIFVFVHEPLWLTEDRAAWEGVHRVLSADGRPSRVISGARRYARDDGQKDNVRYSTVPMTGAYGADSHGYASAHSVTLIDVTRTGHRLAVLPYDATAGVARFPGTDADAVDALARTGWVSIEGFVQAGPESGDGAAFEVVLENPTGKRIGFDLETRAPSGWSLSRARIGGSLTPGQTLRLPVSAEAPALANEQPSLEVIVTARYPVASGGEQAVIRRLGVPVRPRGAEEVAGAMSDNGALALRGRGAVRVELGERPWRITAEAWVRAEGSGGSSVILSRMIGGAGFGLVWSRPGGVLPGGLVGTDRGLARAGAGEPLEAGVWRHVALTYDGADAVLFIDGREAGRSAIGGALLHADTPLLIGAEANDRGDPVSFFTGLIDEVRVSSVVRYTGEFTPSRVFPADEQTLLLMHFDTPFHGAMPDDSGRGNHGWVVGSAEIVPATR
jgi:hypothetical protein